MICGPGLFFPGSTLVFTFSLALLRFVAVETNRLVGGAHEATWPAGLGGGRRDGVKESVRCKGLFCVGFLSVGSSLSELIHMVLPFRALPQFI